MASKKTTSVSLGSRTKLLDEMKKKGDRSRSAVVRRALDFYYMMNYLPAVQPEPGEVEALNASVESFDQDECIELDDLIKEYAMDSLGTAARSKATKKARSKVSKANTAKVA